MVPLAITRTNGPWTHTSDDNYIYQLSLVLATAFVSFHPNMTYTLLYSGKASVTTQEYTIHTAKYFYQTARRTYPSITRTHAREAIVDTSTQLPAYSKD